MENAISHHLFSPNLWSQSTLIALGFCVLAFCVSFLVAFLLTRFIKQNFVLADSSKTDLVNVDYAPKAGGLGVILGVCVVFVSDLAQGNLGYFLFYMLGGAVVFLSGFVRDMGFALPSKICWGLKALGVCLAIVGLDIWLKSLGLGFEIPYTWGVVFSILVIVGFCNAMSVIDRFNGLSGGFALCVCLSMISVAISVDMFSVVNISAILGSAVLGFLALNFPNGKVLLGSGGAYFLGFGLSMILVILTQTSYSIVSPFYGLCVMIYPLWEMVFVFFREKILDKKDSVYFHTLLFRRLGNNPLTSLIILCAQIPFIALGTLFYADTLALAMTCVVFIFAYTIVYNRLIITQDS